MSDDAYVPQPYPRALYRGGVAESTIVHNKEEHDAKLADGWGEHPSISADSTTVEKHEDAE